jgi:hypothetical protein
MPCNDDDDDDDDVITCDTVAPLQLRNLAHLAELVDNCTEPYLNFGLGKKPTLSAHSGLA